MKNRNPSSNRLKTLLSLGISGLALVGAVILGIDDNPPGLVLVYIAAVCSVLAIVHPWRSKRQFGLLAIASLLGFVLFAFLHNVLDMWAFSLADVNEMKSVLEWISTLAFLIAVLILPAALGVGLVGIVVLLVTEKVLRWKS